MMDSSIVRSVRQQIRHEPQQRARREGTRCHTVHERRHTTLSCPTLYSIPESQTSGGADHEADTDLDDAGAAADRG